MKISILKLTNSDWWSSHEKMDKRRTIFDIYKNSPTKEHIASMAKKYNVTEAAIRVKFKTPYRDGKFSASPLIVEVRAKLGLHPDVFGKEAYEPVKR